MNSRAVFLCLTSLASANLFAQAEAPRVAFQSKPGHLAITIGQRPFATYVYKDNKITRPYFAHVRAAFGEQVTRNHPPVAGDSKDHATMHPGIWLAFGDISGHDYWRLKAKVVHDGFVEQPTGGVGHGSFSVRNRYLSADGQQTVCTEICHYTIHVRPGGHLLVWDSTFGATDGDFYFGDQEEMGLGVRVATPLVVKNRKGGRILNDQRRRNEKQIWGRPAAWCDYGGQIGDRHVGITVMTAPGNFRACWWHVRDYGFMAANPFGRKALTRGDASKVVVADGEALRLRFGVLVRSSASEDEHDFDAAFADFKSLLAK